jgi:RNAse (barnase) inhibitor barstar
MRTEIVIDGNNFDDLEGFYCEIDRVLTKDLNWKTGHNLDAFNDLLRGGFGVHEYGEPILLRWKNYDKSRVCLGYKATIEYYEKMLKTCHPSNFDNVKIKLENAKKHMGFTILDMIIETILDNDNSGHDCKLETD